MNAINKIIPCNLTACHPAAMAAAQLILMNGLDMKDMQKAWDKWCRLYQEASDIIDEKEDERDRGDGPSPKAPRRPGS